MLLSAENEIIGGVNPVLAQLQAAPERVVKLLIADDRRPDKRLQALYDLARQAGCPVQTVPMPNLNKRFEPGFRHQGVVAYVMGRPPLTLETLAERMVQQIAQGCCPMVLALADVTDPHNIGAILRVADATGITAVLLPRRGGNAGSPVISKTSAGAAQTVDCVLVPNLGQAMDTLKRLGCWVVGTVCAQPGIQSYRQLDWRMPIILLMGSEGRGLSEHMQKQCDVLTTIPMHGQVDSLNVACATTLLAYEWLAQQQSPCQT